jgi:hypothetical protein
MLKVGVGVSFPPDVAFIRAAGPFDGEIVQELQPLLAARVVKRR